MKESESVRAAACALDNTMSRIADALGSFVPKGERLSDTATGWHLTPDLYVVELSGGLSLELIRRRDGLKVRWLNQRGSTYARGWAALS